MKYNELLELYKQKALNEDQMKQVEADIERQEAISEYLFDRDEAIADFLEDAGEIKTNATEMQGIKKGNDHNTEDFVKMINRSIRRAFIKMGIVVAVITLAITLFIFLALPKVVDHFYYNPGESVGEEGNRLSLDLAVYTELRVPNCNRDNVAVESRGYGKYDILIYQNVSYNSHFTNLAGRIEKGNMTLYNSNVMRPPTGNAFAWFQMEGDSSDSLRDLIDVQGQANCCAAGDVEQATRTLESLDENERYVAYVTLDKMMGYEDFMEYLESSAIVNDFGRIWCAVCTENGIEEIDTSQNGVVMEENGVATSRISMFQAENIGFNCDLTSSHALDWNREKYPNLLLWDNMTINAQEKAGIRDGDRELRENMKKEDFMKTHLVSMLRYMADSEEFLNMMKENPEGYRNAADYVEEHGIMVYGFAGITGKETILELNEDEAVYEIYVNELQ